jgi:hypothetical protein
MRKHVKPNEERKSQKQIKSKTNKKPNRNDLRKWIETVLRKWIETGSVIMQGMSMHEARGGHEIRVIASRMRFYRVPGRYHAKQMRCDQGKAGRWGLRDARRLNNCYDVWPSHDLCPLMVRFGISDRSA